MIYDTIKALNNNKHHEAVIRISYLSSKDLEKLLISFLINDYTLMYKTDKKGDVIIYEFDLPDAYTLTFKLYENDSLHYMTLEFYYESMHFDKILNEMLDCEYYEIKLLKKDTEWKNISDKYDTKAIQKLIKRVV